MPTMTVKIPGMPGMIAAAPLMPTGQTTARAGWSVSAGYRDFQLYPQPMKKAWSATGVGRTDSAVFSKPWSASKAARPSGGRVPSYGLPWKPRPLKPSKLLTAATAAATFRSSLSRTVSARTMAWLSGVQMVSGSFLVNDAITLVEQKISPFTFCLQSSVTFIICMKFYNKHVG
jgi:hypothetical protein